MVGKTVTIDSAYDTMSQAEQQQFRQAGLSVGFTNPVVAAVQTGRQMAEAAQHAKGDARLTALAAATTGLAAKNLYDGATSGNPAQSPTSVGVSISLGASKSDNQSQEQASTAVGSTVSAGRNVTIAASGAGADSNINVIGSTVSAGNKALLAGDGGFQVNVKGNTDLKGGVIASSDKAVQDGVNSLTTATLTHSDIENHASYDASSIGLSGGVGGQIGKDQKGTATNVNPVSGTTLPKGDGGLQVAPPVALSASGDANSTTKSGISGGAITITDGAKQQQLTGQTAAEAVASVNRDTSNTGGALAPIFDKDKIQAGFDITSQFIN
uniref:hemagglutinin repeat-containing protein n=1 Tax=Streptomyces rochei TaxID=1928 RepID=UPI0036D908EC